jgi:hypothetical protein
MTFEGYSIAEGVVSSAECIDIVDRIDTQAQRSRAGARHLMSNSAVETFTRSPPLLALARDILGVGATPYRATLFEKSGQANWLVPWHQDTALPLESSFDAPGWGPWSKKAGILYAHAPASALSRVVALRVHLDASTAANGPLRVIPGRITPAC